LVGLFIRYATRRRKLMKNLKYRHIAEISSVWLVLLSLSLLFSTQAHSASLDRTGLAWRVTLENSEIQDLKKGGALASMIANPEPAISKAIAAGIQIIDVVNEVGGRRGVEITGLIGTSVNTVTPKGSGPYDILVGAVDEISGIGDHWAGILHRNVNKAGDWLDETHARWNGKGPRDHGRLEYQPHFQPYEKFAMISLDGGLIALQWHTGYLSDQAADHIMSKPHLQSYEKWYLVRNSDGSVSISSYKSGGKWFLSAQKGRVQLKPHKQSWERFDLVPDGNGLFGLRAKHGPHAGQYLSARPAG
jgi:hypothetical protein